MHVKHHCTSYLFTSDWKESMMQDDRIKGQQLVSSLQWPSPKITQFSHAPHIRHSLGFHFDITLTSGGYIASDCVLKCTIIAM